MSLGASWVAFWNRVRTVKELEGTSRHSTQCPNAYGTVAEMEVWGLLHRILGGIEDWPAVVQVAAFNGGHDYSWSYVATFYIQILLVAMEARPRVQSQS